MFLQTTGVQRQVLISSCLFLGQALIGYTSSWPGPVIPKLRHPEESPLPYLLNESQMSVVATVVYLGAVPGPYIMTWLSNTKGRKICLISGGIIFVMAYAILATTVNLSMLYVGRIIAGFGGGTIGVMNMVYIGEIASSNIRGILLTVCGVFATVGSILMFCVGSYVTYRGTCYVAMVLCTIYTLCLLWIPESPLFYALHGKNEELTKVLQELGRSEDVSAFLKTDKEVTTTTKQEWRELFTIKSNRKALFIGVVINICQQCCGVMAIITFSATIFEMAGSSMNSNLAMIIIAFFELAGSVITPFFIESAGRKRILLISCTICSLTMFTLGIYFYLHNTRNAILDNVTWLPLVVLILFYIGYDCGLGIIPNAIVGEMFTSNVRSKGSTVAMTSAWLFGFAVTTTFGVLLEIVGGHVAFWLFSCTNACAFLFTMFFIPETKGKTLLEIQESL